MYRPNTRYDRNRVDMMWNTLAFADCREYAFFNGKHWSHPKKFFVDQSAFLQYLCTEQVSDVHAKALPDNGGREWVIDVDFSESDAQLLNLKIAVACKTFRTFFGDSISHIMHTGNRGIHVWLRIDRFRITASRQLRAMYYKAFVLPKVVDLNRIEVGSFIYCVKNAIESLEIQTKLSVVYKKNDLPNIKTLIVQLWPFVDQHVFCHLNQIRVPYSFNYKGKKYSYKL
ncbi:LEF-1 [Buzura suppressaria nucleopolyhedrovirus]|uniref:LEF-1 n=1 Tax=Buzura suppressaria nuclear polyhedrosis virus TaxID=74320 RepID=W5VKM7_NPVBS|nr:LEF-1 [Buzura suppressaria nucleopolyhedrovirus]AHH82715.1 LEF-1 [Buzura suppressaria nucleopolyhedrovirus]